MRPMKREFRERSSLLAGIAISWMLFVHVAFYWHMGRAYGERALELILSWVGRP